MAKASSKASTDQKTLALITEVKKKRAEIAKLDRPVYKTNCSFRFDEGTAGTAINLHVETDLRRLTSIAAFLIHRESGFAQAAQKIGADPVPSFSWNGYSLDEWLDDLRTRVSKIQIAARRAKLEALEERLRKIISPEMQAQLELASIQSELGKP